jgi:hypothetical protein
LDSSFRAAWTLAARVDDSLADGDERMQLTDILQQMGGIDTMARELGVDQRQVASGAEALLPAILGGFKRTAQAQPTGLEGLGGQLRQLGGGGLLDEVLAPEPTNLNHGNDVLGQIFGSPDVSRSVAQHASAQSGLDPALLKKLLPMLAMVVGGMLAKQQGFGPSTQAAPQGGGLDSLLGSLLGGGGMSGSAAPGGSASGLGALLDMNGDGNALDDILRMASGMMRR